MGRGKAGVVDFHAFRDNDGEYIVKELVLTDGDGGFYTQVFFKPPYDKSLLDQRHRQQVEWLETHFHRIKWEYGDVAYSEETMKTLCSYFATIYVKGGEKVRFLQKFHPNVRPIPDSAPKVILHDDKVNCPVHVVTSTTTYSGVRCALNTAIFYMEWLKKQSDYTRESCRLLSFINNNNINNISTDKVKEMAKAGFYYDCEKDKVVCAWCGDVYDWHIACVKYYVHNIPIEFDVVLPRT